MFNFSQSLINDCVFLSMNSFVGTPASSAAWTFFCAFSSTPVKKNVSSPWSRCHRAIVSVNIFSKAWPM